MTNATSHVLEQYFTTHSFSDLTTTTSMLAIALLLLVGVEREVLRAVTPQGQRRNFIAFAIVVLPMAAVFATIIVTRFVRLS